MRNTGRETTMIIRFTARKFPFRKKKFILSKDSTFFDVTIPVSYKQLEILATIFNQKIENV